VWGEVGQKKHKSVGLSSSLTLVFELYCAKPSVAGLPTRSCWWHGQPHHCGRGAR
jgi:hypothetical protein